MSDAENNIVREWLRTLDLSHHLENFIDNGYDDLETCKQIGEEDMDAIGIHDARQREELRQAVARLKQEGGTAVYFTLMGPDADYIYEEDVQVDYGYDEDEKVPSMIDGVRGGMCDCNNCDCLQNSFDTPPRCYLDRNRWRWTEHHLRRGSYEGATEYRRMVSEHPEVLMSKQRSASTVDQGGFIEAIRGPSPHEQQGRVLRSLKDSGLSQHSGSSLTSTGSDTSSGPTSPEHAMSASTDNGGSGASGESTEPKRGRSRSLRNLFTKFTKKPGDQQKTEGGGSSKSRGEVYWKAGGSNLSNEDVLRFMEDVKENKMSMDEAWTKVIAKEADEKRKKETRLGPRMTQLSPPDQDGKSPQVHQSQSKTKPLSAEESPITPSDTDSARGTEGATGSDESPHSVHNYYEPADLLIISPDHRTLTSLEERLILPRDSRTDQDACDSAIKLEDDDLSEVGRSKPPAVMWDKEGLTIENGHAKLANQSEDRLANTGHSGPVLDLPMDLEHLRLESRDRTTVLPIDRGEYLEPTAGIPRRNRAKSSPADPMGSKGRSFLRTITGKLSLLPTSSLEPLGSDKLSEASDLSLERDGTLSSCTSSSSSKSSGGSEPKRPAYEVEPPFLNSRGEYIGPYIQIAVALKDVPQNPHDVHMLPLKTSDLVHVTSKRGGYWDGVCGKRRGKFKFIDVQVLSFEELEKEKLKTEEQSCGDDENEDGEISSEVIPKFANLKELLERIECEQYYSILHLHDFGNLERFKYLEEADLESLNITDPKHIVQLTTAAQMLRDPKAGKERASTQHLHGLLWPARKPKGRTMRDSGFYASTETCVSIDSSGLHRCSEVGDSLIEECETGYLGDDGVITPSPSDENFQENSNVNNSNCVDFASSQNGFNLAGQAANLLYRRGMSTGMIRQHLGNGISSSPPCPRKEGNGSCSPHAHHVCRTRSNSGSTQSKQRQVRSPSWNGSMTYPDSPLFKHKQLNSTYSDPGSAPNSPNLTRQSQRPQHRCPSTQTGNAHDHQCPLSPEIICSDDPTLWRQSAHEGYGSQEHSHLCGSGPFLQSSLAKTHPSPKFPRRLMEQYHCHAFQSAPFIPAVPCQQKPRRKSRSMSPHHKHHHHHQKHHHHQHSDLMMSQNSVHGTPTLPLRPSKLPRQPASAQLEWLVERSLRQDNIDLKEEPYSNKMGFCGVPPALVQRYAEELEANVSEVAICVESIRVKELVDACRCWFRSDTLATQSTKVVYAGSGSSVDEWLTSLGLPMYAEPFKRNGWDELDIVIHIDKDDLSQCRVEKVGHLRRLLTALEHLKMSWKPV